MGALPSSALARSFSRFPQDQLEPVDPEQLYKVNEWCAFYALPITALSCYVQVGRPDRHWSYDGSMGQGALLHFRPYYYLIVNALVGRSLCGQNFRAPAVACPLQ